MDLRFIENGTNLTINPETLNEDIKQSYRTIFYDMLSVTSFFVEGEEFYNDCGKLSDNKYVNINFFRNSKMYTFKGKVENPVKENDKYLTRISQLSPIEITTRRQSPRHEMFMQINIYSATEQSIIDPDASIHSDQLLFTAQLFDISNEGLCVLTNKHIESGNDKVYFLEFTLNHTEKFVLPSRLIRHGDCRQSVQFKYDYGFLFDFSFKPSEKQRLITSIFNHRLSNWDNTKKK